MNRPHDSRRPGTTQDKETRDDEGFVVTRLAAGALWPLAGLSSAAPAEPEAPGWRSEVRWGRSPAGARCRPPPRSWAATYMRHQRPETEGGWRERDEWSKEKQIGRMQEGINELKNKNEESAVKEEEQLNRSDRSMSRCLHANALLFCCQTIRAEHTAACTFLIAWHFEISELPIILSGEQILMKGNCESSAIFAAKAVFPLCGGPDGVCWEQREGTIYCPTVCVCICVCVKNMIFLHESIQTLVYEFVLK